MSKSQLSDPPAKPPVSRVSRLAALDQRLLSGLVRSLGPGGASAAYTAAVQKALVDEMAEQLRAGHARKLGPVSEIAVWAEEIIVAFREEPV